MQPYLEDGNCKKIGFLINKELNSSLRVQCHYLDACWKKVQVTWKPSWLHLLFSVCLFGIFLFVCSSLALKWFFRNNFLFLIDSSFKKKKKVCGWRKFPKKAKTLIIEVENASYNERTKEYNLHILWEEKLNGNCIKQLIQTWSYKMYLLCSFLGFK